MTRTVQIVCDICHARARKRLPDGWTRQVVRLGTTDYEQVHAPTCPAGLALKREQERNP